MVGECILTGVKYSSKPVQGVFLGSYERACKEMLTLSTRKVLSCSSFLVTRPCASSLWNKRIRVGTSWQARVDGTEVDMTFYEDYVGDRVTLQSFHVLHLLTNPRFH